MRRLRIERYIVAIVAASIIVACASAPQQSSSISFMVSGDPVQKAAYEQLVQAFEARHAGHKVHLIHIPSESDYRKRLGTDFAAGTPAEVVLLNYRRYGSFAARGVIEPLGPYLDRSRRVHRADFYAEALRVFHWQGNLTCIPQNVSSLVVYYNKRLFDAAGIAYPAQDWTLEDFGRVAQALTLDTDGDGRVDQYGAGIEPSIVRLAPFVWQNGGDLVFNPDAPTRLALDRPEALETVQWFVDLQTRQHVVPSAVDEQAEDSESRFMNGRTAMLFESRRIVPALREIKDFDWDVAPLPVGRRRVSILHSDGYCMTSPTRQKDAAWAFIEFAISAEGQKLMAGTGRTVPSLRDVAESPAFLSPEARPRASHVFLDALPFTRGLPITGNWPDVEEVVDAELERAFYGQVSVATAVAAAQQRAGEFLRLSVALDSASAPAQAASVATPGAGSPLDCLQPAATITLPAQFPKELMWPDGTIFLQAYAYPGQAKQYLLAAVPLPLEMATAYYKEQLPQAGYTLKPIDAEPGEYDWAIEGSQHVANIRIAASPECSDVTGVEYLVTDK